MLPPAMVFPIHVTFPDELVVHAGAGVLRGWAIQENSAAAGADFVIYDGPSLANVQIAPISLTSNESTRDYPPGNGIIVRTSLVVGMLDGEIAGSLWFTPLTYAEDLEWAFGERGPYLMHPGS